MAESASYAERHVYGDPRASCFHARHALEQLVKRIYRVDKTLSPPKVTNLDGYLSEPAFRRTRARGRLAEGGVHPAGGQRRGARQEDARTGGGAGGRPGALPRRSTGRAAPTSARARRTCRARPSTNPSSRRRSPPALRPASRSWRP